MDWLIDWLLLRCFTSFSILWPLPNHSACAWWQKHACEQLAQSRCMLIWNGASRTRGEFDSRCCVIITPSSHAHHSLSLCTFDLLRSRWHHPVPINFLHRASGIGHTHGEQAAKDDEKKNKQRRIVHVVSGGEHAWETPCCVTANRRNLLIISSPWQPSSELSLSV